LHKKVSLIKEALEGATIPPKVKESGNMRFQLPAERMMADGDPMDVELVRKGGLFVIDKLLGPNLENLKQPDG
jgi:hypothetical protein